MVILGYALLTTIKKNKRHKSKKKQIVVGLDPIIRTQILVFIHIFSLQSQYKNTTVYFRSKDTPLLYPCKSNNAQCKKMQTRDVQK